MIDYNLIKSAYYDVSTKKLYIDSSKNGIDVPHEEIENLISLGLPIKIKKEHLPSKRTLVKTAEAFTAIGLTALLISIFSEIDSKNFTSNVDVINTPQTSSQTSTHKVQDFESSNTVNTMSIDEFEMRNYDVKIDLIYRIKQIYPSVLPNCIVDPNHKIIFNPVFVQDYAKEIVNLSEHGNQTGFFDKQRNYGKAINKGFCNFLFEKILINEYVCMLSPESKEESESDITKAYFDSEGYIEHMYFEMLEAFTPEEELTKIFFEKTIKDLEDFVYHYGDRDRWLIKAIEEDSIEHKNVITIINYIIVMAKNYMMSDEYKPNYYSPPNNEILVEIDNLYGAIYGSCVELFGCDEYGYSVRRDLLGKVVDAEDEILYKKGKITNEELALRHLKYSIENHTEYIASNLKELRRIRQENEKREENENKVSGIYSSESIPKSK